MTHVENDSLYLLLLETLKTTFETMAFAETTPCSHARMHRPDERSLWARIGVESDDIAALVLSVPHESADELFQTMYPDFEQIENQEQALRDMTAEIANVITGRFMLDYREGCHDFLLTVPEIGSGECELPDTAVACRCVVEDTLPVIAAVIPTVAKSIA